MEFKVWKGGTAIMKNTVPMVVSEKSFREVFSFAEDNSALAKNLYNAALFRIRQVFTG